MIIIKKSSRGGPIMDEDEWDEEDWDEENWDEEE